jgi:hypothetical protein
MDNNPNMIDSLFVPRRCILHTTQIGEHVREYRKEFLTKGSWYSFKGYSYSTIQKIKNSTNRLLYFIKLRKDMKLNDDIWYNEIKDEMNRRNLMV